MVLQERGILGARRSALLREAARGRAQRPAMPMDGCTIWLGPEVETVEAVNYFGMDMGKLAVSLLRWPISSRAAACHLAARVGLLREARGGAPRRCAPARVSPVSAPPPRPAGSASPGLVNSSP